MTSRLAHSNRAPLDIGATFAGYRIEGLAGRQRGLGRVYVATHLESERRLEFPPWPVALKVFAPPVAQGAAFRERFEEMAGRQQALRHPNAVSVYEVGTTPLPFISMTLFRGPNLADLIAAGELDDSAVLSVVRCVAGALEAGREHGLVYRRLRPGGVLVATDGPRAFLGDFGAARSPKSTELVGDEELGTFVDYISPEEVRGAEVAVSSNVYSLAAIAFECLTGEPPFPHQEGDRALRARLDAPPRRLRALRPDLPKPLERVLARGLDVRVERRPASPGELIEAMERAYPRKARNRARSETVSATAATPAIGVTPPLTGADTPRRGGRSDAATVARPVQRASASRPERKPRLLSPALLLVALLVLGAVVLGALVSPGAGPSAQAKRLASGPLELDYPPDWTPSVVPGVPGLELSDPVALAAPAGDQASDPDRMLIAGGLDTGGADELPQQLLNTLPEPPSRQAVDLGGVQAFRYERLQPGGLDREVSLYVVPTSGAPIAIGCLAPSGAGNFMARCERIASTLGLRGISALALAPSPSYAGRLRRLVSRLDASRSSARLRLAAASTAAGQASAAARLSLAYREAQRSAAGVTPPPGASTIHADIVRALGRAGEAYRRMAAAATARNRGRWNSARAAAASNEEAAQSGLEGLRQLGYDPAPGPAGP